MTMKRVKQAKSRKSLFHFKPEKVNKPSETKRFQNPVRKLQKRRVFIKQFACRVYYVSANLHVNLH